MDVIIQARTGSKRFPNKIFAKFLGKTILDSVIEKIKSNKNINKIIIATTKNSLDDNIEKYCNRKNILIHRGSEKNVLQRFIDVCEEYKLDKLLRICSDNPLLSSKYLDVLINHFNGNYDYCSFYTKFDEPAIIKPIGVFAEGVSRKALNVALKKSNGDKLSLEHVTYFIHKNFSLFKIKKIPIPASLNPELRFTIDYEADLVMLNDLVSLVKSSDIDLIMSSYNKDDRVKEILDSHSKSYPKVF